MDPVIAAFLAFLGKKEKKIEPVIFVCLLNVMTIVSPLGYIMNYIVLCHWEINKEAHNCSSKSPDYVTPLFNLY